MLAILVLPLIISNLNFIFVKVTYTLEKEMATHSSILAWEIPWTEEPTVPGGHKELDTTEVT